MGCSPEDETLTLMRWHSYMKPLRGGSPACDCADNLKGIKGLIYFSLSCLLALLIYFRIFHGMMRVDPAVAGSG